MYGMAAGCHSPVAVSGSDGNAFAGKSIETVNTLNIFFLKTSYFCRAFLLIIAKNCDKIKENVMGVYE